MSVSSQSEYTPTAFADDSWPIVGEPPSGEVFLPMQVHILPVTAALTDQMFADFGGVARAGSEERWHLPEGAAYEKGKEKATQEDAAGAAIDPQEIERIRAEAFQQGRQAGIEETALQQTEKLAAIERRIAELVADMRTQIGEALQSVEQQAVAFSVAVAKKIIDTAVEINPEYIVPIIREALKMSGGAMIRKVRVSPQDHEFIEVIGVAKQIKEYDGTWEFVADDAIRAGCIVETSAGAIDFNIEQAWERVRDAAVKVPR